MPRTLPRYTITLRRSKGAPAELEPDTRKRRAIRRLRNMLRLNPPHTRGEVRGFAPGERRGALVYQARLNLDGKIVVEEL